MKYKDCFPCATPQGALETALKLMAMLYDHPMREVTHKDLRGNYIPFANTIAEFLKVRFTHHTLLLPVSC
jgi:hypothetical protein